MVPVVICGSGRAELGELLLSHGWQRNHRRDGVESADGKVALKGWGKRKLKNLCLCGLFVYDRPCCIQCDLLARYTIVVMWCSFKICLSTFFCAWCKSADFYFKNENMSDVKRKYEVMLVIFNVTVLYYCTNCNLSFFR